MPGVAHATRNTLTFGHPIRANRGGLRAIAMLELEPPLTVQLCERFAGRAPCDAVHCPGWWQNRAGGFVDQLAMRFRADALGEVVHEQRAVDVRALPTWPHR